MDWGKRELGIESNFVSIGQLNQKDALKIIEALAVKRKRELQEVYVVHNLLWQFCILGGRMVLRLR